MSSNLGVWFDVPNGSTMSFWASSDGDVSATAEFDPDANDQPDEDWTSDDLMPGPQTREVQDGASYGVRVAVTFQGVETEQATIHASVVNPAGQRIGADYDYTVEGKRGDAPRRAHLSIINANPAT